MTQSPEGEYYRRQTSLEGFGKESQEALRTKSILIIGLGGLGCPVAETLCTTGIGKLTLIDFDKVELKNLHRQSLFDIDDIGKNKAQVAAERLQKRNPYTQLEAHPTLLDLEKLKQLAKGTDLIIDTSDNMDTRMISADQAYIQGIPYISGALYAWESYVYHFKHESKDSANYRDLYPEGAGDANISSCAEIGVLPPLCAITAQKMAHKALFELLGWDKNESPKFFEHYDFKKDQWTRFNFKTQTKNPIRENNLKARHINITELTRNKEAFQIIDVREPEEFDRFNIGGQNIALKDLSTKTLQPEPDKKIVFVCQTGVRSNTALSWLNKQQPKIDALHLFMGLQQLDQA